MLASRSSGSFVLLVVLPILLAVACGPDKTDDSGGSETSMAATSAATEPTATGDVPTGSSGSGGECVDPSAASVGPAVAVTIRNNRDTDVFITASGFCGDPSFALFDAANLQIQTLFGSCPPTCADLVNNGECGCPDIGCPPGVVKLVAGGVYQDTWSGGVVSTTDLPAECVDASCSPQCSMVQQAAPGMYTFRSEGSASFTCDITCDCTPNADGWCELGGATLEPELLAEAVIGYPDATAVELVFE